MSTSWSGTITSGVITFNTPATQKVSGPILSLTIPEHYIRASSPINPSLDSVGRFYRLNYHFFKDGSQYTSKSTGSYDTNIVANSSINATAPSKTVSMGRSLSSLFSSSNPTTAYVDFQIKNVGGEEIRFSNGGASILFEGGTDSVEIGTIRAYLDAPPTFTAPDNLSFDTSSPYTGVTTASVIVSDAVAYYGGTIESATLTIGNQTATISGDGTLSILLNAGGTFTPTITVTDSRGQTTTKSLDPITVNVYAAPSVSFTADRTLESGVPDDEGAYATVDARFTFADVIAAVIAPSVVLTDENGTQTTPTVTWFSSRAADGTLSGSVTWSSLSSGDTVYGRIPNVNTQYSYQISIRPRDDKGTGTAITQTLSSAFYTVDFLAGGHGIAFGKPASETGFECAMDATFDENIYIDLSDYQTTGSVDKELYDAIVALGWDSDVLVN